MSIKVLAEKALQFKNPATGEKKEIKVGFGNVPNWVENTDLYKDAVAQGIIKPFGANQKVPDSLQQDIQSAEKTLRMLKEEYDMLVESIAAKKEELATTDAEITSKEEKLAEVQSTGDEKVKALRAEIADLEAKKNELTGKGNKK